MLPARENDAAWPFKPKQVTRGRERSLEFMNNKVQRMLFGLAIVAFFPAAHALPIVDTGASPFVGPSDSGFSIASDQLLAGRFTTTEDYAITELSAFVRGFSCCNSSVTSQFSLSLRSGDLDGPSTTLAIGSTTFTSVNNSAGWASVAIDDYLLSAGTWWIVASVQFERGDGSVGLGMPGGVPNPMDRYSVWNTITQQWREPGPMFGANGAIPGTLGFRVNGEPLGVPEPGVLGLFLTSMVAAFAIRRRRRLDQADGLAIRIGRVSSMRPDLLRRSFLR